MILLLSNEYRRALAPLAATAYQQTHPPPPPPHRVPKTGPQKLAQSEFAPGNCILKSQHPSTCTK